MNETVLSVIIPVYNAEKTIRNTLGSVLGMSLREIEVICVDDGSKDRSVEIIQEIMAQDERLSLICQQNLYAGTARNRGIEAAKGEYLFFLDADDYVLDYGLEAACHKARKHRIDVLKFLSLTCDEKSGQYIDKPFNSGRLLKPEDFNRVLDGAVTEESPMLRIGVTPWNGIYRRAFVLEKKCRFNSLRCVNDRSFYNKVITCAERLMISQDRVTVHLVNQEQSLVGKRAANFDCQIESLRVTEEQLTGDGVAEETAETIMFHEYRDLVYWYRQFSTDPERKQELKKKIEAYLQEDESAFDVLLRDRMRMEGDVPPPKVRTVTVRPFRERSVQPAVTVLMPVHGDAEETLNLALDSLTRQDEDDLEFLLLDAGTTGACRTIMREYAAVDKRFEIIETQATGYGQALNTGMEKARGEYITVLEQEDWCAPGLYECLRQEAEKNRAELVLADFIRFRFNPDGTKTERQAMLFSTEEMYGRTLTPEKQQELFFCPVQTGSALYRRNFLTENKVRWNDDAGFAFREDGFRFLALSRARKVRLVRQALYRVRMDTAEELLIPEEEERQMTEEYRWLHTRLAENPKQEAALRGVMYDRMYRRMMTVYSRVTGERREAYLLHMQEELRPAWDGNFFDKDRLTKRETDRLERIIANPEGEAKRCDISVILPVRGNGADTEDCLKALLARSGANIEVLLTGFAGADAEATERIAARDSRIRVAGTGAKSTGEARNTGLAKAQGSWCLFPDEGDRYETDTPDRTLAAAEAGDLDILIIPGDRREPGTGEIREDTVPEELLPEKQPFAGTDLGADCFGTFSGETGNKLFRTLLIREKRFNFAEKQETGGMEFTAAAVASASRIRALKGMPMMHHGAGRYRLPEGGFPALSVLRENLRKADIFEETERAYGNFALAETLRQLGEAEAEDYERIYAAMPGRLKELGIAGKPCAYFRDAKAYRKMIRAGQVSAGEYLLQELREAKNTIDELRKEEPEEENPLLRSTSYRIGRAVTLLPRKIRTAGRLVKEGGIGAAVNRGRELMNNEK